MKFPYKLSKERLSLLSKKDREIYEYEHSSYGQAMYEAQKKAEYTLSQFPSNTEIKEFSTEGDYSDEEKDQINEIMDELLLEFIEEISGDDLKKCYGEDEYDNVKKSILEFVNTTYDSQQPLNEAEGHSADWWLPDLGWVTKLAGGVLTGVLGSVAWLLMAGKDKLAMNRLKKYMNKLVELTDQGINKKRPWYSYLIPFSKSRNNTGEYSRGCFRTIQETEERNLACLYTQTAHALGFYNPNSTDFSRTSTTGLPEAGSGLDMFKANVLDKINLQ